MNNMMKGLPPWAFAGGMKKTQQSNQNMMYTGSGMYYYPQHIRLPMRNRMKPSLTGARNMKATMVWHMKMKMRMSY